MPGMVCNFFRNSPLRRNLFGRVISISRIPSHLTKNFNGAKAAAILAKRIFYRLKTGGICNFYPRPGMMHGRLIQRLQSYRQQPDCVIFGFGICIATQGYRCSKAAVQRSALRKRRSLHTSLPCRLAEQMQSDCLLPIPAPEQS